MFHFWQPGSCSCITLHTPPALKLIYLRTHDPKPLVLAGAFRFQFKPLRFRLNCDTNGTFLSSPSPSDTESLILSRDYLIDSLGLPPESATRFTKLVRLKSAANADSVVALFREYGFTSAHMAEIFSAFPKLLNSNPVKTLKPKLDYFVENGISGDLLHHVLTSDPHILRISLHRKIIPCFQLLKSFYGGETGVAALFSLRRGTWVLRNFTAATAPNVETLLRNGVPKPNIAKLFNTVPSLSRPTEEFEAIVREVKEMGFDPSGARFVRAVRAFSVVSKEKREAKVELLRSYGWTEDQIRSLMVKQPQYLSLSVEKLRESLEFFMTENEWSIDESTKYFALLTCNIRKRISPRFSVLKILNSRGLVEKISFGSAFQATEANFLEKFVKRYEEELPHLQQVYDQSMRA